MNNDSLTRAYIISKMIEIIKDAAKIEIKTYPTEEEKTYLVGWAMGHGSRCRDMIQTIENFTPRVRKTT